VSRCERVVAEVDRPTVAANRGVRYDWLVAAPVAGVPGGLYLDAWAHLHRRSWRLLHGMARGLYSGFFAVATARWRRSCCVAARRHGVVGGAPGRLRPEPDRRCSVLLLGGVLDMLWHTLVASSGRRNTAVATHLVLRIGGSCC